MLVGIVQVDDVQVLASSVVVKERHGSKHVEDAEPFCMEGGRVGAGIGREMDLSGGEEHRKQEGGREVWVDREREMEGRRKRQRYVERKFGRLRTNEREREEVAVLARKKDSGSTKRQRKKRQTECDSEC